MTSISFSLHIALKWLRSVLLSKSVCNNRLCWEIGSRTRTSAFAEVGVCLARLLACDVQQHCEKFFAADSQTWIVSFFFLALSVC